MFIIKFIGILDLLAGIAIFIAPFVNLPFRLLLTAGFFLIVKKFIFKGDLLSTIDFGVGCYALIAILFPMIFFSILGGSYLFLKGFYSIVGLN